MFVGVLTTCHTQYTWDRNICIFPLIEQHSKFLLHTLQVDLKRALESLDYIVTSIYKMKINRKKQKLWSAPKILKILILKWMTMP
jgi:hypothetical protein